jgi:aromatic ring-opening dioxygenase catalytic subunit (LigB family)
MLPTYFVSHGGGPWPYMKEETGGKHDLLEASLKDIPRQLGGEIPKATLVVSGHWEEREFRLMSSPRPPIVYDYSGFPAHTYRIRYDSPGSPEVADRALSLLASAGLEASLDPERGYDHGAFAPLYAIYPEARIPVLQLSLKSTYDPAEHIRAGRALAPVRGEGVLIVGSGLSYHNLRRFGPEARESSKAFDDWLQAALAERDPERRAALVADWARAPAARQAHPREDHLVPLFVALGAAYGEEASRIYHEEAFFGGITVSSYRFG